MTPPDIVMTIIKEMSRILAGIILDGWIPNPVEFLMDGIMRGIGRIRGDVVQLRAEAKFLAKF